MPRRSLVIPALCLLACSAPAPNALGWTADDIAAETTACRATHQQILDDARQAAKTGDLAAILAPDMNRSKEMLDSGCACQAAALARTLPRGALFDPARDRDPGALRARLALACLTPPK
jgi:hypothetical protein